MKRTLLTLILLGIIPFACHQVDAYLKIDNLTCEVYKDDELSIILQPVDTISNNQVFFRINITYNFVSYHNTIQPFDLSIPIYAFDKRPPGFDGLKDKLSAIKILSSNNFNGHNAGIDLKELFKWHDVQWDRQKKSIDSLVIELNESAFFIGGNPYFFKLILMERPNDNLQHTFDFDFVYESGNHQLVSSTTINWRK